MIKSRYFITAYETMYGCTASCEHYMPLPNDNLDMVKCLKKWYNHLTKSYHPEVQYVAMVEREDGSIDDLSVYWFNEYLEHTELC